MNKKEKIKTIRPSTYFFGSINVDSWYRFRNNEISKGRLYLSEQRQCGFYCWIIGNNFVCWVYHLAQTEE